MLVKIPRLLGILILDSLALILNSFVQPLRPFYRLYRSLLDSKGNAYIIIPLLVLVLSTAVTALLIYFYYNQIIGLILNYIIFNPSPLFLTVSMVLITVFLFNILLSFMMSLCHYLNSTNDYNTIHQLQLKYYLGSNNGDYIHDKEFIEMLNQNVSFYKHAATYGKGSHEFKQAIENIQLGITGLHKNVVFDEIFNKAENNHSNAKNKSYECDSLYFYREVNRELSYCQPILILHP